MGMMPMIAYRPPWPVVAEAPAYTGSIPPASSGETPSFTVSWTASSDPESGIKEYEYVVTKDADPEGAFEEVSMPPGVFYIDRKSTRLNSSHVAISYAVFCLKK